MSCSRLVVRTMTARTTRIQLVVSIALTALFDPVSNLSHILADHACRISNFGQVIAALMENIRL
jgi:hypothetical protein